MTSGQESSNRGAARVPHPAIESLAGVFHPHAIEVQDFSYYALVIDVRPRAEYEEDHIPGAVRLEPPPPTTDEPTPPAPPDPLPDRNAIPAQDGGHADGLPAALAAIVEPVGLDQAILIYCGRGGRVSQPLAKALRWRGWTVDVLGGGWINYRRWVQAGLEVLPRLLTFRVVACSLGSEAARVLRAFREVGQQVLDVEALAGSSRGSLRASLMQQPAQAWFESQLLQAIRALDPRSPVWIGDLGPRVGALAVPGALRDALATASVATLDVPITERVRCWKEDEPLLAAEPSTVIEAAAGLSLSPSQTLLTQWKRAASKGLSDLLLGRLLTDCVDPAVADGTGLCAADRHVMCSLRSDSMAPRPLTAAARDWLSTVAPSRPWVR
jgi:tRNA 2-selenouridine synthase